jgi:hypothetical protein
MSADKFLTYVDQSGPSGCWLWVGCVTHNGYGRVSYRGRLLLAHRAALLLLRQVEMPRGVAVQVDHLCRNRRCVNPDHLEIVAHGENLRRSRVARWGTERKVVCVRGHLLRPPRPGKHGDSRRCRQCQKDDRCAKSVAVK